MNDITRDRILKNVYNKINELIEFFQTNGSSDVEIEKRINSSMNGLVSSIKYGDVPFSLDSNEETKIKKKEPDKPKEEKLTVKEEKEEMVPYPVKALSPVRQEFIHLSGTEHGRQMETALRKGN